MALRLGALGLGPAPCAMLGLSRAGAPRAAADKAGRLKTGVGGGANRRWVTVAGEHVLLGEEKLSLHPNATHMLTS